MIGNALDRLDLHRRELAAPTMRRMLLCSLVELAESGIAKS
jgi:hypothetical protein